MELRLYDTLSREKRAFVPLDKNNVRMYVCGPTVYDFAHIGNARPVIVFDVLFRLLRHLYGEAHVTYVRNITDVDDKINARALRDHPDLPLNDAIRKVTEATASQFQADVEALGCLTPTYQPRATDFVLPRPDGRTDMKSLIQQLLDRNHAYLATGSEGKEILFDVSSMQDYGALSKRRLDQQIPGARIAVDSHKRNAEDFVLWKESGAKEPGWNGEFKPNPKSGYDAEFTIPRENASELQLNSRVVAIHGRPGWHIECSAMSAAYLDKVFDIHGGGLDLIFPHHENEIAQSRCAHGTEGMANFWMHNGFVEVEGRKMSKSEGNFVTIRELLEKWPGDVLRLQMLMTHYRSPSDWTEARAAQANAELEDWAFLLQSHYEFPEHAFPPPAEISKILADDLDTPNALTLLREQYSRAKKGTISQMLEFASSCRFLGFRNLDRPGYFEQINLAIGAGASEAASKNARRIQALRAAYANNAPSEATSSITSEIEKSGVRVEVNPKGKVILVLGQRSEIDAQAKALIDLRNVARANKNFAEADRLRGVLAEMGVTLRDFKDPDTGEPKSEIMR
ncbi:cysteine--tRNA ligase [Bradyrhizobium sp. U531]|uniref:cysteine--tRNA ligase n=1 Tax=Bradyrhizobium sp. U531 TaxID=3053458 RepID=UPI003F68238E